MPALFLPCAGGVEALLADEVLRITGIGAEATRGGVWVEGDPVAAMRLNLESRLATRVLWPLADGRYRDEHDLYDLARRVDWGTGSRRRRRCGSMSRRCARRCRA